MREPGVVTAFVDQVARDQASKALSDLQGHEDLCAERYGNIHDKLGFITRLLGWGGATLATIVIGIIGGLSMRLSSAQDSDRGYLKAKVEFLEGQLQRPPQGSATR